MKKYTRISDLFLKSLGIFDSSSKFISVLKSALFMISTKYFILTGVFDLINVVDDLTLFADNFSMMLVGFAGYVRLCSLVYNRDKMQKLRKIVNSDDRAVGRRSENDDSIIREYDELALTFSKNYGWLVLAAGEGLLLQPLPAIVLGYERRLPFPAVYPFAVNSTGTYVVAYAHQTFSTYVQMATFMAFDTWFIFLIYHACGQYSVLQNWLENISERSNDRDRVTRRIVDCVRLHQKVYRFSQDIEDAFNVANLFLFLLGSIAICINGYQATRSFNEPQILVKHFSSALAQIVQLLLHNWCGELIEEKSFGVSLAISRSDLYKLEVNHQRDLGVIMLRAQRPARVTAGKFYNLSLPNFTNLMKTSLSYFTVLTSVEENRNA